MSEEKWLFGGCGQHLEQWVHVGPQWAGLSLFLSLSPALNVGRCPQNARTEWSQQRCDPSFQGNPLTTSNVGLQAGRSGKAKPHLLGGRDSFIFSHPAFSPYGLGHSFATRILIPEKGWETIPGVETTTLHKNYFFLSLLWGEDLRGGGDHPCPLKQSRASEVVTSPTHHFCEGDSPYCKRRAIVIRGRLNSTAAEAKLGTKEILDRNKLNVQQDFGCTKAEFTHNNPRFDYLVDKSKFRSCLCKVLVQECWCKARKLQGEA